MKHALDRRVPIAPFVIAGVLLVGMVVVQVVEAVVECPAFSDEFVAGAAGEEDARLGSGSSDDCREVVEVGVGAFCLKLGAEDADPLGAADARALFSRFARAARALQRPARSGGGGGNS